MAIYTNLPIYRATYDLLLEVERFMPNVPRQSRYTLCQNLNERIMEILVLVYKANASRNKLPMISQMRSKLVEVQVFFRLLADMRHISEKMYVAMADKTSGMSRQLAAWEKSERTRQSGGAGNSPAQHSD